MRKNGQPGPRRAKFFSTFLRLEGSAAPEMFCLVSRFAERFLETVSKPSIGRKG
jgi:hypothetical protein